MEVGGVAVAFEYDDLGIVEALLARRAGEVGRRPRQRTPERVLGGVEAEFASHDAGPGQHHHGEPQRATATARHRKFSDVSPVDLGPARR
jgi:hypothetical protein